jgi:hypothetical protein
MKFTRETEELEVIKAAEEAALAESEAASHEAAAVAVAHGMITQEEVDAYKRYCKICSNLLQLVSVHYV